MDNTETVKRGAVSGSLQAPQGTHLQQDIHRGMREREREREGGRGQREGGGHYYLYGALIRGMFEHNGGRKGMQRPTTTLVLRELGLTNAKQSKERAQYEKFSLGVHCSVGGDITAASGADIQPPDLHSAQVRDAHQQTLCYQ